jgi:hypothetical protein
LRRAINGIKISLKAGSAKQRGAGFLGQSVLDQVLANFVIDLGAPMHKGQLELTRPVLGIDPTVWHFGVLQMRSGRDKHEMRFRNRTNAITMDKY